MKATKAAGLKYEVIVKDSKSNPNRAAAVAKDLIVNDQVSLMLVASTPETTNPVATTCEAEGLLCVSTVAPWQPWFIGQQGKPADPKLWKPFEYAYHFFWGLEDVIGVYTNMWGQIETNKQVGGMFPNDGDGNAWGDATVGFPPVLAKLGYQLTDPGRYQNLTDDFSAQINAFKRAGSEIVTGVMIPPDFTTFWNQAQQQGFRPKAASIGKALLFPQSVEALGKNGNNLSTEVWWTPHHPFKSSLTGESAAQLAEGFSKATGRQWTQPIGFVHALFEVAANVLKRVDDPSNAQKMVAAAQAAKRRYNRRPHPEQQRQSAAVRGEECLQDASRRRPVVAEEWRRLRPCHHRQPDGAGDPDRRQDGNRSPGLDDPQPLRPGDRSGRRSDR